jgi:hypothetical protein
MAFADADFTRRVAEMLEKDFAEARPMQLQEYQDSSFWFRFAVAAARLSAPVQ